MLVLNGKTTVESQDYWCELVIDNKHIDEMTMLFIQITDNFPYKTDSA